MDSLRRLFFGEDAKKTDKASSKNPVSATSAARAALMRTTTRSEAIANTKRKEKAVAPNQPPDVKPTFFPVEKQTFHPKINALLLSLAKLRNNEGNQITHYDEVYQQILKICKLAQAHQQFPDALQKVFATKHIVMGNLPDVLDKLKAAFKQLKQLEEANNQAERLQILPPVADWKPHK